MERVLVLGASGLVGTAVSKELSKKYDVYGTYSSHKTALMNAVCFDISKAYEMKDILDRVKPEKIVYCLRGEFDAQIKILHELVKYLTVMSGKLYFCSTVNVFDGDTTESHLKSQEPFAESDYGKFKIACEQLLKKGLNENGIILRLPMIWGKDSPRLNSILASLENREKVDVYTNLYFNSNTDEMLAKQICYIMENDLRGVFHLGSNEVINHYDFIRTVIKNLGYKNVEFNEKKLSEEKYYLAGLPTVGELPKELTFTNEYVIKHITN